MNSERIQDLGTALIFILFSAALPLITIFGARLLQPYLPHAGKLETYECGEIPKGSPYVRFNPRFYLVGLMFLIFDIEILFLFPTLSVFREMVHLGDGLLAVKTLSIFLFLVILGLAYEWRRGDLDWAK